MELEQNFPMNATWSYLTTAQRWFFTKTASTLSTLNEKVLPKEKI